MEYDKSLDVESFRKALPVSKGELEVSLHSYNGGDKKLQISRKVQSKDKNGLQYANKLGRLTKDEIVVLSKLLAEAHKQM